MFVARVLDGIGPARRRLEYHLEVKVQQVLERLYPGIPDTHQQIVDLERRVDNLRRQEISLTIVLAKVQPSCSYIDQEDGIMSNSLCCSSRSTDLGAPRDPRSAQQRRTNQAPLYWMQLG